MIDTLLTIALWLALAYLVVAVAMFFFGLYAVHDEKAWNDIGANLDERDTPLRYVLWSALRWPEFLVFAVKEARRR